ncbi:hypothetical protein [Flexivirga meconopsidis]|uniref:hypothetical protein n=1 Tax=Flexivirga meconopsidis TaxID=2977121 RepID=UPI0022407C0D|nr:hypothetical protein [Flexivirga meconopsidis]
MTSPAAAALADLRSTVKWLVGAAGGTAVVLVGGLQLTRLHDLGTWRGIVSAAAAAVAIGLALWLLTAAARILAVPRPSATEISAAEINAGSLDPDDPEPMSDDTVRWVRNHAETLLAGERTVTDLCSQRALAQEALGALRRGQQPQWHGRPVSATDLRAAQQIAAALHDTDAALVALEDAVHHYRCQEKLAALLAWLPWAGTVFVIAVIVFAISSADG